MKRFVIILSSTLDRFNTNLSIPKILRLKKAVTKTANNNKNLILKYASFFYLIASININVLDKSDGLKKISLTKVDCAAYWS